MRIHRALLHGLRRAAERLKRPPITAGPAQRGDLVGIDGISPPSRPAASHERITVFSESDKRRLRRHLVRRHAIPQQAQVGLARNDALPFLPPASVLLSRERSSLPLGSGPEWQSRHRLARIGATFWSKSPAGLSPRRPPR